MFIASTPLRVSLFGGSTDNPAFIEKYGYGAVMSFASNLRTHVILTRDSTFGYNQYEHQYIINYSKRESVNSIDKIENELVRVTLEHFGVQPLSVYMTSDVFSQGSGLASSSSYLISLIKAICLYKDIHMTQTEICALAYELELKFNPHCGYQDPYGCGVGGFKKIEFTPNGIKYQFLDTDFFKEYDMHLVFTGITRNSKTVLSSVTDNIEKARDLLPLVEEAQSCLIDKDYISFINFFNDSWQVKKNTSPLITENESITLMDIILLNEPSVLGHKLCGAGNGGFFLVISKKNTLSISYDSIKVEINEEGVVGNGLP